VAPYPARAECLHHQDAPHCALLEGSAGSGLGAREQQPRPHCCTTTGSPSPVNRGVTAEEHRKTHSKAGQVSTADAQSRQYPDKGQARGQDTHTRRACNLGGANLATSSPEQPPKRLREQAAVC